jgi:FKBP-type peptidyl-prolyl cis-trans isomerase
MRKLVLLLLLLTAGCASHTLHSGSDVTESQPVTTESGLIYIDKKIGTGLSPIRERAVSVHYTGTLENGKKFDSSVDRSKPFSFIVGTGTVIRGWDEGIMGMKEGGVRRLIVPPSLGYGSRVSSNIPPNSTLIFDIELLEVDEMNMLENFLGL